MQGQALPGFPFPPGLSGQVGRAELLIAGLARSSLDHVAWPVMSCTPHPPHSVRRRSLFSSVHLTAPTPWSLFWPLDSCTTFTDFFKKSYIKTEKLENRNKYKENEHFPRLYPHEHRAQGQLFQNGYYDVRKSCSLHQWPPLWPLTF